MYLDLTLAKTILGIDGTSLDSLITFYINSATQRVINIIGRDIKETTLTLKETGNDDNVLYLDLKPISNITNVLMNGEDITSDIVITDNNRGLYYANGFKKTYDDVVKTSSYSNESYCKRELNEGIEVTGTFGYSEIPYDIQDVVSNIVQNSFVKSGICQQVKEEVVESEFGREQKEYFNIINKTDISEEDYKTLIKYK